MSCLSLSLSLSSSLTSQTSEPLPATDSFSADLMDIITANVCLTQSYHKDDPKKFSMATPAKCLSALKEHGIVPSERMYNDIMDWPRVIKKIVKVKGTKVEGEGFDMVNATLTNRAKPN